MSGPTKLRNATFGFDTGYFWRVSQGTEVHIVFALNNRDAAEICGWKTSACDIEEMKLVSRKASE